MKKYRYFIDDDGFLVRTDCIKHVRVADRIPSKHYYTVHKYHNNKWSYTAQWYTLKYREEITEEEALFIMI